MTQIQISSYQLKQLNHECTLYINLISYDLFEHFMHYLDEIHRHQFINWLNQQSTYHAKLDNNVKKLNLDHVSHVPLSIYSYDELRHIECGYNKSIQLPTEIYQLKKLESFCFRSCGLSKLSSEIGHLVNLTKLDLDNNRWNNLPGTISQLSMLQTLDLSSNRLTELPIGIYHLTNLTDLRISCNKIPILLDDMGNWCKLVTFMCGYNTFTYMPDSISKLTSLQKLRCADNMLTKLPKFSLLTSLNDIHLTAFSKGSGGIEYYL